MRFRRRPKLPIKPITPRRIAISERKLKAERDHYPLLNDWIAQQQPTAVERLENFQECEIFRRERWRDWDAKTWKEARAKLRLLPPDIQHQILDYWNNSNIPADSGYFADAVRRKAKELGYLFPNPYFASRE